MAPSLPIPTDNIYKFSCLFGLALIVSAIFSFANVYSSLQDKRTEYMKVIIALETNSQRTTVEDEMLKLNKRLLDLTEVSQYTSTSVAEFISLIGTLLSLYGSMNWYRKIQKRDDRLAELQIQKLEAEIAKIKSETPSTPPVPRISGGDNT